MSTTNHPRILRIEHFGHDFIDSQHAKLLCTGIRHHLVLLLI